ncbi:hypothetical protein A2U01_0089222, partial [Trifolium medium]|nr:hypothetical protein [Trifolium medium]
GVMEIEFLRIEEEYGSAGDGWQAVIGCLLVLYCGVR